MEIKSHLLGDMLLEAGLIDQFQLDSALSMQRNLGGKIGAALVKLGYLSQATIAEFLTSQERLAGIHLDEITVDAPVLDLLSYEKMRKFQVFPAEFKRHGNEKILRVAMADPADLRLIEDLQFVTGCRILPLKASTDEIMRAIEQNQPVDSSTQESITELEMFFEGDFAESEPLSAFDRLLTVLTEKGLLTASDCDRIRNPQ